MMRIAVIGCGAIADTFHLPGLRALPDAVEVVLVDPSAERAGALARKHACSATARSHSEVLDTLDAAIVASPAASHVPIALDLVAAGVPVLCEKPLGTTVAEVEALVAASEAAGVIVAVNQTRRFIPACGEIARLIGSGELGEIRSIDAAEGDRFGWPAATPAMFGLRSGGRGVLLDIGVHVLDLLTWWLGEALTLVDYRDDSFGGSESSATVRLATRAGAPVSMRLSWLAKQRNTVRIEGSRGSLEWMVYDLDTLTLREGGQQRIVRLKDGPKEFAALAPLVIADFVAAVAQRSRPRVTASDALPSMRLIEASYRARARYDMPFHDFEMNAARVG